MNYDIFISYSREDKTAVYPLIRRINEEVGTQCWIDLDGIESGEHFEDKIMQTIDSSKIVLFLLSNNSLQSTWTKREIYYAEKKKKKIIPIVVDGDGLRGWFQFHFGAMDYIDIKSEENCQKLIRDLKKWLGREDGNKNVDDNNSIVDIQKPKHGLMKYFWLGMGAIAVIVAMLLLVFKDKEQNHVFSVSTSNKVVFSKGNLQYQASTKTWRFAENQWDYIGIDNEKISSSYDGWIDLFGWGTGNNPTKISENGGDYISFRDWGNNMIINGEDKQWRTLTKDEWEYLLDLRETNSGVRYAKVKLIGTNGVVILPDDWNASIYKLNDCNNYKAAFSDNIINQKEWKHKLEAKGAVFFPAAGSRTSGNKIHERNINYEGAYWSATFVKNDKSDLRKSKAYDFFFRADTIQAADTYFRYGGRSVRLVSDIK